MSSEEQFPIAGDRRRRARALTALLACALAGCGSEEADDPTWIPLARGYEPVGLGQALSSWGDFERPLAAREELAAREGPGDPGGVWLETAIEPGDWQLLPEDLGLFAPRAGPGFFRHHEGERVRLSLAGGEASMLRPSAFRESAPGLPTTSEEHRGVFAITPDSVLLRQDEVGTRPTETVTLSSFLERGHSDQGVFRATIGSIVGDGIPVWTGETARVTCELPPRSALRFRFALRGLTTAPASTVEAVVRLDGEELWTLELEATHEVQVTSASIDLPTGRRKDAEFTFEVRGAPAACAFFDPVLGPREIGTYGARPWGASRPDLVVFLADTFRADNLAAWGGDPAVAPNLNALVERSCRFLQARAVSVWTLPTHASMFTGLYPMQHGATAKDRAFSGDLVTIAEHLSRFGYRTGAITEGAFVSRHYALDQGFAWFDENSDQGRLLARTLAGADAFLDHDDGRPVFLFVHTYRVHAPYRVGPEEDDSAEKAFLKKVGLRMLEMGETDITPAVIAEFVDEYHGLYLDGVRGLDRAFQPWFESVEARGLFRDGAFVFTSDHGEEFYEHGNRFHRWAPHEEKIRVPLFFHGDRIEPRAVSLGASQVDLAPTLARLAGLPPLALWPGEDVLALERERTLLAYNLKAEERAYLAAFSGARKVHAPSLEALAAGELEGAFDLTADPGETASLHAGAATWPREFALECLPLWERLSVPVGSISEIELDAAQQEDLKGLGYVE